jgi:putative oxidoreductase
LFLNPLLEKFRKKGFDMTLEHPILRLLEKLYSPLIIIGSNLQSAFLLYLRLLWGYQLFTYGMDKLQHIGATIQFFSELSIPSPAFHAYEVALIETICGAAFTLGFASRLASIPTLILMISALSSAHSEYLSNFQFITNPHMLAIQEPYPYLFLSLLVFIFGPGRISIDAWIKRWLSRQPRY